MSARRIDRMTRRRGRRGPTGETFAAIPTDVLTSPAWRTLPHVARSTLTALAAQYSGRSNGSLTLTERTAAQYGLQNPRALYSSLRELEARGLIIRTRPGSRRPPKAAMYALAWRCIDEPLAHDPHDVRPTLRPPDEWRAWTPTRHVPYWTAGKRAPRVQRGSTPPDQAAVGDRQLASDAAVIWDTGPLPPGTPSHTLARAREAEKEGKHHVE